MVGDVNSYRRAVELSITELTDETKSALKRLNNESQTAIESGIRASTQSYEALIKSLEQTINQSATGIETSIETLAQASRNAGESVDKLSDRIAAIEIAPEVVERAVNKPFEKLEEILNAIEARQNEESNSIARLATTINSINESADNLRSSISAVENLTIPEDLITNSIRPVFSNLEGLLGEVRQRHEADAATLQNFAMTIESLTVSTTQLQQSLQSVTSTTTAIAAMQSEFSGLSNDINTITRELASTLSEHKNMVGSLKVDADETTQYLRERRERMKSEIELIQSANRQVFDHLAQLSNVLVEKLSK